MILSQFNLQRYENIGDAQKIKRFFVFFKRKRVALSPKRCNEVTHQRKDS